MPTMAKFKLRIFENLDLSITDQKKKMQHIKIKEKWSHVPDILIHNIKLFMEECDSEFSYCHLSDGQDSTEVTSCITTAPGRLLGASLVPGLFGSYLTTTGKQPIFAPSEVRWLLKTWQKGVSHKRFSNLFPFNLSLYSWWRVLCTSGDKGNIEVTETCQSCFHFTQPHARSCCWQVTSWEAHVQPSHGSSTFQQVTLIKN